MMASLGCSPSFMRSLASPRAEMIFSSAALPMRSVPAIPDLLLHPPAGRPLGSRRGAFPGHLVLDVRALLAQGSGQLLVGPQLGRLPIVMRQERRVHIAGVVAGVEDAATGALPTAQGLHHGADHLHHGVGAA